MTTTTSPADADAVDGRQMDEPRFFGARDHPRADAGLLGDRLEEFAAVLGLARRAGRDGDDLVDAVRFGEAPELRQHLQRGVHRLRRERAAVEAAGAQPDHFLLAVDDLEGQVGADLHHDHVERIGADVDGGDAHGVLPTIMGLSAAILYLPCRHQHGVTISCRNASTDLRRCYRASTKATCARSTRPASRRAGCAKSFRCFRLTRVWRAAWDAGCAR